MPKVSDDDQRLEVRTHLQSGVTVKELDHAEQATHLDLFNLTFNF
jgi:hypothetical protein